MFTIMVKSRCLAVEPGFVLHSHLAMRVLMSSSLGTRTWQGSIAFSWSYLQAVAGGEAQGAQGGARIKAGGRVTPATKRGRSHQVIIVVLFAVVSNSKQECMWGGPQACASAAVSKGGLAAMHGIRLTGNATHPIWSGAGVASCPLLLKAFRSRAMTRGHFLCPTHPWSLSLSFQSRLLHSQLEQCNVELLVVQAAVIVNVHLIKGLARKLVKPRAVRGPVCGA